MITTINSVERQLRLIPPCQDCNLILFWETPTIDSIYRSIDAYQTGWTYESIRKFTLKYPSARLVDWVLTKEVNNAPTSLYIPSNCKVEVDVVYVCSEGYYTRGVTIPNYSNEGEFLDLHDFILATGASPENPYYYFGYVTKPMTFANNHIQSEYETF